ncbi:chromate transporter [uncultured Bacteroides sp.]|uniref:chromate transporter n=1 Tax=uncultured Bacteroides sp. TaxID=162156 RepID=UPI002AA6689B|nr:chromate transporter [uncultured Bacteroides sp.]
MLYLQLFYSFFKIGLFGFGGGYGMLSLIQSEVVTHHTWLSAQEFTDIVAISQMTPGPIGINAATYVGFTATGSFWGSLIATFAVILPSFILMLTISKFFLKYQKHPVVEAVFTGLRPAIVGLLASAVLVLMTPENFGAPTTNLYAFIISMVIFAGTFIANMRFKTNPILLIIICGVIGLLVY